MPQTGPRTRAGKEITRLNAVRHGILSVAPVVPGVEDPAAWQHFYDALIDDLEPVGAVESMLAEHVAIHAWRLNRVFRHEAEAIAARYERAPGDYATSAEFARKVPTVAAAEANLGLSAEALRVFKSLRTMDGEEPLPNLVCRVILVIALTDEPVAPVDEPPAIDGLPPFDAWETYEGWNAGLLSRALAVVAEHRGMTLDVSRKRAIAMLEASLESARDAVQEVQDAIETLHRQRLVPDERTIQTIIRYHAQIERAFYRALHELQVLQAKRCGEPPPIARMQWHGLPGP